MVSISAPSTLASFTAPKSAASGSKYPHVSLGFVEGSAGKLGTATVQGDGVWTYDLAALRPISTFTVPPSTVFTTPAVSYYQPVSEKSKGKQRQTEEDLADGDVDEDEIADAIVVGQTDEEGDVELSSSVDSAENEEVASGPVRRTLVGVKPQVKGEAGQVRIWDGEEGSDKVVLTLDKPIVALHHLPLSPYPIIAIHSPISSTLIGPRLTTHTIDATNSKETKAEPILASRVIANDATFSGIITVSPSGRVVSLRLSHPEDDEGPPSLHIVATTQIKLDSQVTLRAATIRSDGLISALTSSNHIVSYSTAASSLLHSTSILSSSPSSGILSLPASKPVTLHHTVKTPSSSTPASLLATLSTSSSASVVGHTDISSLLPTPESSIREMTILGERTDGYTYVVGCVAWHPVKSHMNGGGPNGNADMPSPAKSVTTGTGGKSIIHLIEVAAPPRSVGLNALLGSAKTTALFFASPDSKGSVSTLESVMNGTPHVSTQPTASERLSELLALPARSATHWSAILDVLASSVGATLPSRLLVQSIKVALADNIFEEVYTAILGLPIPDMLYRIEMGRQLTAEEGTEVLEVLARMVERRVEVESERGVRLGEVEEERPTSLPPLAPLLTHLSITLDSLLPTLIAHPQAHLVLTHLSTLLDPLLQQQRSLSQLRAPVDALLVLSKREEQRRNAIREKRAAMRNGQVQGQGKEGGGQGKRTMNRGIGQDGAGVFGLGEAGLWSVEDFDF